MNGTDVSVYGSCSTPVTTMHRPRLTTKVRSRPSTWLRWSQPSWSVSAQAGPNWARAYPVLGARPFTGSAASAEAAAPSGWGGVVGAAAGGNGRVTAGVTSHAATTTTTTMVTATAVAATHRFRTQS
jgi:hypothetical protein